MKAVLIITGVLIAVYIYKRVFGGAVNKKISYKQLKDDPFNNKPAHKKCPKCGKEPKHLDWYKFRTSNASWRNLAGAMGFYSKCPDCEIMVENICVARN
jgi:hypothetical protein